MKKLLLPLAAIAALGAAAAPAAAQTWQDHGRYDHSNYDHYGRYGSRLSTGYVDSLQWKIENAARNGRISWGEARQLRAELRSVQPLAWRVQTGAANGWEVRRLETTVERIERAVNRPYGYARRDYDRWR